ncbi:hypothetical protein [Halalkalicoccus paucihalophilus]|uniref:hypothetical protein n=1 Tax=Halalkalicoccus paucihalophilus TaxID=1008153 RepID=UPI001FE04C64|nr:hypothetical protein [Halalkalicoccus paucihalophilus]
MCHEVLVEADGYESTTISDITIPDDDGMTVELTAEGQGQKQEQETKTVEDGSVTFSLSDGATSSLVRM